LGTGQHDEFAIISIVINKKKEEGKERDKKQKVSGWIFITKINKYAYTHTERERDKYKYI
jgi:hypothetical protein